MIRAWAATGPKQPLERYEYDPGALGPEEVEIAVETCGICHSDLSIINNEWGISTYPVVPGHEVTGRVVALGAQTKGLTVGQAVGVGWGAASCMHCHQCLSGDQNLCAENVPTIVGHHGGFADRLRVQWPWAVPLPDGLDMANAGPLLCGALPHGQRERGAGAFGGRQRTVSRRARRLGALRRFSAFLVSPSRIG